MDWDTLADFSWGSVETDFMFMAKCGPEVSHSLKLEAP